MTSFIEIVTAVLASKRNKQSYFRIYNTLMWMHIPSIAENRISADITGYNSTQRDIDVNFPSSCRLSSKT